MSLSEPRRPDATNVRESKIQTPNPGDVFIN